MIDSSYLPMVYGAYGAFALWLTVWLARVLKKNGDVFLKDVFSDRPDLAVSVNQLLVVGFYLVNFGYACLLLEGGYAPTAVDGIEVLASKMGFLLLTLAFMHFVNLFIFQRIRRRAQLRNGPLPVAPQMQVAPLPAASSNYIPYDVHAGCPTVAGGAAK